MNNSSVTEYIKLLFSYHQNEFSRKHEIDASMRLPIVIAFAMLSSLFLLFSEFYNLHGSKYLDNGFGNKFFLLALIVSIVLICLHLIVLFSSYTPVMGKRKNTYTSLKSIEQMEKEISTRISTITDSETQFARAQIYVYKNLKKAIDINTKTNKNRMHKIWIAKRILFFSLVPTFTTFITYFYLLIICSN